VRKGEKGNGGVGEKEKKRKSIIFLFSF